MTLARTLLAGTLLLTMTACFRQNPTPSETDSGASSSVADFGTEEAHTGVIEEMGVSVYMQGSHRLTGDDGQVLLLESESLDLDQYEGARVTVEGKVRPTVESGGRIMNVTWVTRAMSDESSSVTASEDASSSTSVALENGIQSSAAAEVSSPLAAAASSRVVMAASSSRAASSVTVATAESSSSAAPSDAKVNAMAGTKLDAANWTQQYCSSHVGFCVPVHKNWWYKSFGATSTSLWHVELSSEEIQNLGDGVMTMDLMTGNIPSGTADGGVQTDGTFVTGYKSWTGGRHFEIRAPVQLRAAVEYMTANLTAQDTSAT